MQTSPINNIDVEQQVLGLLIKDHGHVNSRECLDSLSSSDFYSRSHAVIFDAIKKMSEGKKSISITLIEVELDVSGYDYGGFVYLAQLQRQATSIHNMGAYVGIVKKTSSSRRIQAALTNALDMVGNGENEDVISFIDAELKDISLSGNGRSLKHISEIEGDWLDEIEKRAKSGGAISGLCTGIETLDEKINGIDDESLVVIAGSPSMGKTLFCQTIATNLGVTQNKNIMFFSMEMSERSLFERFVSGVGNVMASTLKNARLDSENLGRIDVAVKALRGSGIYITDEQKQSVGQIRAKVRRHKNSNPELAAIFIDYLGLMKLGKADRHDIAIGNITRDLKELAKEVKVPVFLCVQAKRPQNVKDRPNMSSLKDSSCIEADADLIMFVHRQEIVEPETDLKGVTELIIAKDRHNDANGTVYLEKVNGAFVGLSVAQVGMIENEQKNKQVKDNSFR